MIAFARACFSLSATPEKPASPAKSKPHAQYRASRGVAPQPALKLSDPAETIIVPWHRDRIDAEIGPDDQIQKLIVYVRRQPPRRRRRFIDRIWR